MTATKKTSSKSVVSKKTTVSKKESPKKKEVIEKETPMYLFTCQSCNKKFTDIGKYFYNKPSKKCLWCTKFPSRNGPKG